MKAELWSDTHQLLTLHVAPRLLLASHHSSDTAPSQQQQQLESELQGLLHNLKPHADAIEHHCAAAGSSLVPWDFGAGLYAEYYALRVRTAAKLMATESLL